MRISVLLPVACLFHAIVSTSLRTHGQISHGNGHNERRDLGGLFGGWDSGSQGTETQEDGAPEQVSTGPVTTTFRTDTDSFNLFSPWITTDGTSKTKSIASSTGAVSSVPDIHTTQSTPTPTATPISSNDQTTSISPLANQAHPSAESSTSPSGTSTWKIVGVAVITFGVVAMVLVAAVFFDHWWKFIREVFSKNRKAESTEEMVPDWEKASWEVRFGDDRHRYPSFASIPPVKQTQGQLQREGSTQVKDWTKQKRLSGGSSSFGGALTTAERTILSPGYPAPPDNVYLNPNPGPSPSIAETLNEKIRTPTVNAPGTCSQDLLNSPARTQPKNTNPFGDSSESSAVAGAYDGIEGK